MTQIYRVNNGWIVEEYDDKSNDLLETNVFEEEDFVDTKDPKKTFKSLLNHLINEFDQRGSPYEKLNLTVGYITGRKFSEETHEQI